MAEVLEFLLSLFSIEDDESLLKFLKSKKSEFIGVVSFYERGNKHEIISSITLENLPKEILHEIFEKILPQITSLSSIGISGTSLSSELVQYLANGLEKSKELLYKIRISDSKMKHTELEIICKSLKEMKKLQYLELSGNDMDDQKSVECVGDLFNSLKEYGNLKDVTLANNKLSNETFLTISTPLQRLTSITKLYLPYNDITVIFFHS